MHINKLFVGLICAVMFCSSVFADVKNGYLFPIQEPVYVSGKILQTGWCSYKRPDMGGKEYMALNYPAREGSVVLSCFDGIIISTGYAQFSGIYIKILQRDGVIAEYNHLSNWSVIVNQTVRRGDIIGYVGRTGRTTGSHLRILFYNKNGKMFVSASTFGMNYSDFYYRAGTAQDLKFDIL